MPASEAGESITYQLEFENEDQLDIFYRWLGWLRATYPDAQSLAERITTAVEEMMAHE